MTIATAEEIEAARTKLEKRLRADQHKFSYPHKKGEIQVKKTGIIGSERFIITCDNERFGEVNLRNYSNVLWAKYNTKFFVERAIKEVLEL